MACLVQAPVHTGLQALSEERKVETCDCENGGRVCQNNVLHYPHRWDHPGRTQEEDLHPVRKLSINCFYLQLCDGTDEVQNSCMQQRSSAKFINKYRAKHAVPTRRVKAWKGIIHDPTTTKKKNATTRGPILGPSRAFCKPERIGLMHCNG